MKEKKRGLKKFSNNRLLYFFVTILIVAVLAVGVYAYGTSNPSIFGHSYGEIGAPAGCSAGQVLQYNGTNFVCGSGAGGGVPSGTLQGYCTHRKTLSGGYWVYSNCNPREEPSYCLNNQCSCREGYSVIVFDVLTSGTANFAVSCIKD
jgi:hypothetical protein